MSTLSWLVISPHRKPNGKYTLKKKNTSAGVSMNYGVKDRKKQALALDLVEAIRKRYESANWSRLDIPYAFIKNIKIDPSHRNTKDVFLEGVPMKKGSVISFMKYLAMDRNYSLMGISDTAEWHHLLEQKMRKNSKSHPRSEAQAPCPPTDRHPPHNKNTSLWASHGRLCIFFYHFPFTLSGWVWFTTFVFRGGAFLTSFMPGF